MATDLAHDSADEIGEINKYNFRTETKGVFKARKGIDADIVRQISEIKGEPDMLDCNCSICSMSGHLHLLVPAIDFRSLGGEDLLSTYQFGLGVAKHTFCSVCGTKPYYRPRSDPSGYSVNVRCLEPSTIADVEVSDFDGRHWEDAIERLMARAREPGASQRLDVTADLQSA